jgi:hypothetical protein
MKGEDTEQTFSIEFPCASLRSCKHVTLSSPLTVTYHRHYKRTPKGIKFTLHFSYLSVVTDVKAICTCFLSILSFSSNYINNISSHHFRRSSSTKYYISYFHIASKITTCRAKEGHFWLHKIKLFHFYSFLPQNRQTF